MRFTEKEKRTGSHEAVPTYSQAKKGFIILSAAARSVAQPKDL
jgi:hypothetical protein